MKKVYTLFLFIFSIFAANAQCSSVGVQISSSDTFYVQLYHAGFFNIPSGFENIVDWEVRSFSGELIHQETTSGAFADQSFSLFNHSVPISDSMKATITITNAIAGYVCTVSDTLYWKETEVIPGAFIGDWDVLNGNVGTESPITSTDAIFLKDPRIQLFPSPTYDRFSIISDVKFHSVTILHLNGQVVATHKMIHAQDEIDILYLAAGLYFVRLHDEQGRVVRVEKLVKL